MDRDEHCAGVRVSLLRRERGLTIHDVCEATGLPFAFETWSSLSSDVLAELCRYFNVSADYFLALIDEPRKLDDQKP